MADLNSPHNAAAPEILAALKALEADLRVARAQIGTILKQVESTVARPATAGGVQPRSTAVVRETTAALEDEARVARQGLNTELERLRVIQAQGTAARSNAAIQIAAPGYRQSAAVAGGRGGILAAEEAAYAENEARRIAANKAARAQIVTPVGNFRSGPLAGELAAQDAKLLAIQRAQVQEEELLNTKMGAGNAVMRARIAQRERNAVLAQQEVDWAARLAQIQATATRLPPGARQGFVEREAARAIPTATPFTEPRLNQAPYSGRQVAAATSGALGADAAGRIAASRARLTQLSITEGEYIAKTRSASAMSGEFLTRLATGQATVGEFGRNLAQTSGKFAGWTAAAAGVGGLVSAATHLFHGARDSAAGVDQLSRSIDNVHSEKAQQGFRDLSRELNVSIKDVSDAQFQFSRTFNNQADSLTAARVGLLAYKLDNVSVADSVRALTSLHNQFGVQASELPGIFDQLDEGQRKFNARVGESLPALNRSTAAVKNAGGNLQDLLKLVVYGVRVSGQTGSVIGNALARSASNFVPKNAKDLRALGLDPTQGYTELLIDAITKAGQSSGEWRRKAAKALGGPQLGSRVFEPLLGASNLFPQIEHGIDPKHSSGAAAGELADKLAQADEQIHKVGRSLERIGSALAESGAFQGLGVALKLLNFTLSSVEGLLNVFNKLPASIRPWVSGLGEAVIAVRILQRTRFGEAIADRTGLTFLGPSATRRAARQQIGGLERSAGALETSAASAQAGAVAAEQERLIALENASAARKAGLHTQATAFEREAVAAGERQNVQLKIEEALARESAVQRQLIVKLQQDENLASAELVAAQKQAIAARALGVEATAGAAAGAAGAAGAGAAAGAKAAAAEGGVAVEAAAAETAVIANSANTLRSRAGQVGGLAKRYAGGVKNFVGGMGTFSKLLTGAIIAQVVGEQIKGQVNELGAARDKLTAPSATIKDVLANRDAAKHAPQGGFFAGVADSIGGVFGQPGVQQGVDDTAKAQRTQADLILKSRAHTRDSYRKVGFSYDELLKSERDDIKAFHEHHISKAEFDKRHQGILASMSASIDALTGDGKGIQAGQKASAAQYRHAFETPGAARNDPFSQFRHGTLQENTDFLDALNSKQKVTGSNQQDFTTITRGIAYISREYGRTNDKKQLQQISQAYQALDTFISQQADEFKTTLDQVSRIGSNIPASQITPTVALAQFTRQGVSTHAAYDTYIKKLQSERGKLRTAAHDAGRGLAHDQKLLADAERKYHDEHGKIDVTIPGGTPGSPTVFDTKIGSINLAHQLGQTTAKAHDDALANRIKELKKKVEKDRKDLAAAGKSLSKRDEKILAEIAQAQEQQFQDDTAKLDLRSQYAQANATDQSDAIAQKIKFDGLQIQLAMRYHGPNRWQKIMQAIITKQQDIGAQAAQTLQSVQLNADLATSRITGAGPGADRARLQSELRGAENVLATAKAEKNYPGKADDIKNAEMRVNNIHQQINSQVKQDAADAHASAEALFQSRIAIRIARAGDNQVKIDKLTLQADQHALGSLKRSDFKSTADYQAARNNALAKVITDRHQITNDTASQDLQDAQFEHNIHRITDEQYIKKLKDILKLKGLSKQMRQSLLMEIYNMDHQNDGDLSLNLGDIRLPSTYQIVRGLRNRSHAAKPVTTMGGALLKSEMHNTFNFNINGGDAKGVAAAVGEALDTATGGSAIANLRAAGAI